MTAGHTRFSQSLILFPLLVMLLLTLLLGMTAYQTVHRWEITASTLIQRISTTLILSNMRWELRQIQQELATNPAQARQTWKEVQSQAILLARMKQADQPLGFQLHSILITPAPRPEVVSSLARTMGPPSLEQLSNELDALRETTRMMTVWATGSMLVLGAILLTITAWDLNRLFQALRRSRDLAMTIQEEERRRIAQDLHDGVIQEMVNLKREYAPEKVDQIVETLRRVCQNLKPQMLADLGLVPAIDFLVEDLEQAGIAACQAHLDREGLAKLPKQYELPVFRVIQELFSNIKHHAQASQVRLTLAYEPSESSWLRGRIQDNGCGFDPDRQYGQGLGLTGVRERIEQLNGILEIRSAPGQGSDIQFRIPVS